MLDLFETGLECGAHQPRGIGRSEFEPRPEPAVFVVRGIGDELDAEMPAVGEADQQHRLRHPGVLDGSHRTAAEHRLEALPQLLSPVRPGEDVDVAAKGGQDLTLSRELPQHRS